MPQTYETPPDQDGARGSLLPGALRNPNRLLTLRSQYLIDRHGVRESVGRVIAEHAYGEGRHDD